LRYKQEVRKGYVVFGNRFGDESKRGLLFGLIRFMLEVLDWIQAFVSAQDGEVIDAPFTFGLADMVYETLSTVVSLDSPPSRLQEGTLATLQQHHFGPSEVEIYFSEMYRCERYKAKFTHT
jgi:hypothetical protein